MYQETQCLLMKNALFINYLIFKKHIYKPMTEKFEKKFQAHESKHCKIARKLNQNYINFSKLL